MPVYSEKVAGQSFPEMDEMVRLGFDRSRKTAWLELRTTSSLMTGTQEDGVLRFLIGAVNRFRVGWDPIQPGDTAGGQYVSLTSDFNDCDQILAL